MSEARRSVRDMLKPGERYNPWRSLRALGPAWKLRWARLEGDTYGYTCHETKTITLHEGMSFEERRCSVAHEVQHAIRGPVPVEVEMVEELIIDRIIAGLLIPSVRALCDALIYNRGDYEIAAEDLWVDVLILEVRISSLTPTEAVYFHRRMADAMVLVGDE